MVLDRPLILPEFMDDPDETDDAEVGDDFGFEGINGILDRQARQAPDAVFEIIVQDEQTTRGGNGRLCSFDRNRECICLHGKLLYAVLILFGGLIAKTLIAAKAGW